MLFNSIHFAVFLPIVFGIYWIIPNKYRWILLLIASYYFYMSWNVKYVVLILMTTLISYFAAIGVERTTCRAKKKMLLFGALVICFGVLFVFKYFNFFFDSVSTFLTIFSIQLHPYTLKLLLPVGISFYTFQTLSYVIDVYRGEITAERNFGVYATFISFFPQLVAGPIERTRNLLPQIKANHCFDSDKALYGLKLMAWGFFKKMVVADNLAIYVDTVYNDLSGFQGFALVLATVFFAFQIYCDFSGYSDIACGAAKLLDIELMRNFKSPYFSASVKEFWSRWHISLSTWFRDYVYIPLGGNRVGKLRHDINLLITFLVSGLWHGANWTFVAWGGVHGLAQIVENALGIHTPKKRNLIWVFRVILVFAFTTLAWVFFRAQNISDAIYVFAHMLDGILNPIHYARQGFVAMDITKERLVFYIIVYFLPLVMLDWFGARNGEDAIAITENWNKGSKWLFYIFLGLVIVFFSQKGVAAEFVYFQF